MSIRDVLGPRLGRGPPFALGLEALLELLDRVTPGLSTALGLAANPTLLAELLAARTAS
jgi:hypothetical protein